MDHKPRYATVRKYAKRELSSGNFCYAIFGAEISTAGSESKIVLARTPEEIVYFVDKNSFNDFVNKICWDFPVVKKLCVVHR